MTRPAACSCRFGDLGVDIWLPCDVHAPPQVAHGWQPVIPGSDHKWVERRDEHDREVAYATRAGTWSTWYGAGFVNRPDLAMAMAEADDNLRAHGVRLTVWNRLREHR